MKTILITGANRGMGRGFAEHYLRSGWRVLATRRPGRPPTVFDGLPEEHRGRLEWLELNVDDQESAAGLRERLTGRRLDVVINNAGISRAEDFGDWSAATFQEHFATNTTGPALVAQAVLPLMASGSKLVNVSSGMGSLALNVNPEQGLDAYALSKAALNLLTLRLAAKVRSQGVIVVAANPGWVQTSMGGPDAPTLVEEAVARIAGMIEALTFEDSGRFLSADGEPLPW